MCDVVAESGTLAFAFSLSSFSLASSAGSRNEPIGGSSSIGGPGGSSEGA